MSRLEASSRAARPSPIATAWWSVMCCTGTVTLSKASTKSRLMRRFASTSTPTASCNYLLREFAASSRASNSERPFQGEAMFTPHTLGIALFMMITSAICWGSWANTYKGVKNYRFELFYWDYAVGIFLISLILAFTMGSTTNDPTSFLNNAHSADNSNIASTMFAGVIFNLANLLLVAGIDMAGLAIAFPVSIGIALVVGVVSSYILQPKGHAGLLAAGVTCALIAVILDGKAYGNLKAANREITRKSIITCIVSGVLMG